MTFDQLIRNAVKTRNATDVPTTDVDVALGWLHAIRDAVTAGILSNEEAANIRRQSARIAAQVCARRIELEEEE